MFADVPSRRYRVRVNFGSPVRVYSSFVENGSARSVYRRLLLCRLLAHHLINEQMRHILQIQSFF